MAGQPSLGSEGYCEGRGDGRGGHNCKKWKYDKQEAEQGVVSHEGMLGREQREQEKRRREEGGKPGDTSLKTGGAHCQPEHLHRQLAGTHCQQLIS